MKKIIMSLFCFFVFQSCLMANEVIIQPPFVINNPNNVIINPPHVNPRPLVKKIKWVATPNVIIQTVPVYHKNIFGAIIVKQEIRLITVWTATPVEVWE